MAAPEGTRGKEASMLERNTRLLGTLVIALVLALTAARPGAAAMGSHASTRAGGAVQGGLFESAWSWLSTWWAGKDAGSRGLSRVWEAMGPDMDPDGKAAPTVRPAGTVDTTTDMGPDMDPDGK
jgi:hypothetical protein